MNSTTVCFNKGYNTSEVLLKREKELFIEGKVSLIIYNPAHTFSVCYGINDEKIIPEGQLILLPQGFVCTLKNTGNNKFLIFSVPEILSFYYQHINIVKGKMEADPEKTFISPLPCNEVIKKYMDGICLYIEDQLMNINLYEIKMHELFFLLKFSFPLETLHSFFLPVLGKENLFPLIVLSNYKKIKHIEELAKICNLSLSSFHRLFLRTFRVTPYKWILQKKSEHLYKEIYETDKPLKIIAEENNFSSSSQLVDYCKKHLNNTPGEIRSKRKNPVFVNL